MSDQKLPLTGGSQSSRTSEQKHELTPNDKGTITEDPSPEQIEELIRKNPRMLLLAQSTLQATTGLYPPPAMMEEYKKIDPEINKQILAEAKIQADHRRSLERLATERSEERLDDAQRKQHLIAILGLLAALALILIPIGLGREITWPVALAAILIGAIAVGGKPVATIVTSLIAKRALRD